MPKMNDLIEWEDCGSRYSMYVKHFIDDEGKKGVTMMFEDVGREKVTEIVIPPRKYLHFLNTVSDGTYSQGLRF